MSRDNHLAGGNPLTPANREMVAELGGNYDQIMIEFSQSCRAGFFAEKE